MKLSYSCPTCSNPIEVKSEIPMGLLSLYSYSCGHTEIRKKLTLETNGQAFTVVDNNNLTNQLALLSDASFNAIDDSGHSAYIFQREGINFLEQSEINGLIADAMGLGKTVQALLTYKRNRKLLSPLLILTRSSIIYQWCREFKKWVDNTPLKVMPATNRTALIPGFDVYIMSMDLLGRKGIIELLQEIKFKCIILDECHFYKDAGSQRTKALIKLIQSLEIKYRIALSGTPIKNRASEYFVILNLLAPEYFRSFARFKHEWLIPNEKGIYTRIAPWRLKEFQALISRWVLRREKKDVLTNLPELTRDYQFVEIEDEGLKQSYNQQLSLFENFLSNTAKITSYDILGWLAKLRAITGQAKCQNAIDWAQEFLDSTEDSLAIGIQHHSVRDTLYYIFEGAGYQPLKLSGEDSAMMKDRIQRKFNNGDNRLLIINSLAGGIGLNLQSCSNTLVLERQWNSADEEQFEGRFHRDGQKNAVKITYMIARGTIDEWFHDMVEVKRKIFGETMGDKWDFTSDDSSIKNLVEKTIASKL